MPCGKWWKIWGNFHLTAIHHINETSDILQGNDGCRGNANALYNGYNSEWEPILRIICVTYYYSTNFQVLPLYLPLEILENTQCIWNLLSCIAYIDGGVYTLQYLEGFHIFKQRTTTHYKRANEINTFNDPLLACKYVKSHSTAFHP